VQKQVDVDTENSSSWTEYEIYKANRKPRKRRDRSS